MSSVFSISSQNGRPYVSLTPRKETQMRSKCCDVLSFILFPPVSEFMDCNQTFPPKLVDTPTTWCRLDPGGAHQSGKCVAPTGHWADAGLALEPSKHASCVPLTDTHARKTSYGEKGTNVEKHPERATPTAFGQGLTSCVGASAAEPQHARSDGA